MKYGIKNEPPPYSAAKLGKRRKFPKPIAFPATARTIPRRDPQCSRLGEFKVGLSPGAWSTYGEGKVIQDRLTLPEHGLYFKSGLELKLSCHYGYSQGSRSLEIRRSSTLLDDNKMVLMVVKVGPVHPPENDQIHRERAIALYQTRAASKLRTTTPRPAFDESFDP